MSITLTHPSLGAVTLPPDLLWTDEYTWKQVEQSTEYTTTGALVVDAWARQAGRPITLEGAEDRAWCERGPLNTLRTWASQAGQTLTLSLYGVDHPVVFNHESGALDASPIVDYNAPTDTDYYAITLRFLEL